MGVMDSPIMRGDPDDGNTAVCVGERFGVEGEEGALVLQQRRRGRGKLACKGLISAIVYNFISLNKTLKALRYVNGKTHGK